MEHCLPSLVEGVRNYSEISITTSYYLTGSAVVKSECKSALGSNSTLGEVLAIAMGVIKIHMKVEGTLGVCLCESVM